MKISGLLLTATLLLILGLTALSTTPTLAQTTSSTITGTGNYAAVAHVTNTPLHPACVLLSTLTGTVTFNGTITTNTPGSFVGTSVLNTCTTGTPPNQVYANYTLNDVTIAGKTGGIVLQFQVNSAGLITSPTGANSAAQITVLSGSGGLAGITGHGVSAGTAKPTSTFFTYWIQLAFGSPTSNANSQAQTATYLGYAAIAIAVILGGSAIAISRSRPSSPSMK